MSEHEVVKHAVRTYTAWNTPAKKIKHKIRDILIEVFIIVFAVSISVYLEKLREHSAEKKLAVEFLTGLQNDLKKDIQELKDDQLSYTYQRKGFQYFSSQLNTATDSISFYYGALFRITGLVPNTSRLDGLKYSGKLYVIENKELQDELLSLYQEVIPSLILSTDGIKKYKQELLHPFLLNFEKKEHENNLENFLHAIHSDKGRRILEYGEGIIANVADLYTIVIQKFQELNNHIEKELTKNG